MKSASKLIIPGRVHYVNNDYIILSRGNKLFESKDNGITWKKIIEIPLDLKCKILNSNELLSRLMRQGVHCVEMLGENIVFAAYGQIYCYLVKEQKLNTPYKIARGTRPLVLCNYKNHTLYFGEYFSNKERSGVEIFASSDGCKWDSVYRFSGIRHIHGVFSDPYSDSIWITTGDNDRECGIFVTNDQFKTVTKVDGGSQQLRAIQLLFTDIYIYFGTDTPDEINHIYRLDKKTGSIHRIQKVDSSVFWGCKVGDYLFFSTTVEHSNINLIKYAQIWRSSKGEIFERIDSFKKDIWNLRLFQYGQVFFPAGPGGSRYLWFTPFAVSGHMCSVRHELNVKVY